MAGLHNEVLPHSRGTIETWGSDPSSAPIAVLAVHGRGQGPGYMRMLFERIDVDAFIAAPAADDASWYPASFLRPLEENQPGLDGGIAAIERALQLLQEAGFGTERVVLAGFSQGACLLSHFLLGGRLGEQPRRFAGALLLTGGYQGPDDAPRPEPVAALAGLPVLMSLGSRDPWVPLARAEQTRDALEASGAHVELLVFEGDEHIVSDEAVRASRRLIEAASSTASH